MRTVPLRILLTLAGLMLTFVACKPALRVFPGAQGFGTATPAGSGRHLDPPATTVHFVRHLSDLPEERADSLRACVESEGPRVCVFEVSGSIELQAPLEITEPYLTIAGQTAPGPVYVRGRESGVLDAHDVLVQHVAFAPGGENPANRDADAFFVRGNSLDVVLDHVSAHFSVDEIVSVYEREGMAPSRVTVSHSLMAYALDDSIHYEGVPHSKGPLVGPNVSNVTLVRNVIAHNYARNPKITGVASAEVVNNLIYNWGSRGADLSNGKPLFGAPPVTAVVRGNAYFPGRDWTGFFAIHVQAFTLEPSLIFVLDTLVAGVRFTDEDSWVPVDNQAGDAIRSEYAPFVAAVTDYLESVEVETVVLRNAGARPLDRNDVDARVVVDIENALAGDPTGTIVDCVEPTTCENHAGGWPEIPELSHVLELPEDPDAFAESGSGYTNLEEWLHAWASQVEPAP